MTNKVCNECWELFLGNMHNSAFYEKEEHEKLKKYDGLKIEELFGERVNGDYKGRILKFIDYKNPPLEEDFNYLKKNKTKFFFIKKINHWIDDDGFSHVM